MPRVCLTMDVRIGVDSREWIEALESLPLERRDPYFGPAFHEAHAAQGDGIPHASIIRDGAALLIVPGLRRMIGGPRGLWDLQTCRTGCAGPLASDAVGPVFLERAWSAWTDAMSQRGGVAAFFRLHPIIGNERWLPRDAEVRLDRSTVVVDLSAGKEHASAAAASRHRNMVRKALRLGCSVTWNKGDPAFERLYAEAMQRLGSEPDLRFGKAFFAALWKLPDVEVAVVHEAGEVVAGAVFVWGVTCGHYLLAARRADSGNHVSNFLLDAGMGRGVERGVRCLYLGGGRGTDSDDALFRFKRSVGTRLVDYRVALVPINEQVHQELVEEWTVQAGHAPSWLLGYRQPLTARMGHGDRDD